jgi:hypothetical protein
MISNEEIELIRDRVADFVVLFTDAILDGEKEDALSVMEDFSSFFYNAISVAKREGRFSALITTTN